MNDVTSFLEIIILICYIFQIDPSMEQDEAESTVRGENSLPEPL